MRRRSFVKAAEPNALQAKALRDAGCRRIFEDATRREIHESVISGRKTGAEMALLYNQRPDHVTHRRRPPHRSGLACSFEQIVW